MKNINFERGRKFIKISNRLLSTFIYVLLASFAGFAQSDSSKSTVQPAPEPVKLPVLPAGRHQQTILTPSGEMMRYTLFIPPNLKRKKPIPLIVALHYGYPETKPVFWGGSFTDALIMPAFDDMKAIIVAPDSIGGGIWGTETNQLAVAWLAQSVIRAYPVNQKKVLVTGYSMGGAGTWFIGAKHQDLFTAAIIVSGKPTANDLTWTIPVYVIHSKKDEVFPLETTQKYVEKQKEKGANIEFKVLDEPSHHEIEKFIAPLKETQSWLNRIWKQTNQ